MQVVVAVVDGLAELVAVVAVAVQAVVVLVVEEAQLDHQVLLV